VEIRVGDDLDGAIKLLRRRLQKEGLMRELKKRRYYEKPSVKEKNKQREAQRRRAKSRRRSAAPRR
jgi:small subunit ribosomal protein S21